MPYGEKQFCLLVLAAGKGTRMKSKTAKVLQTVLEEPLLYYPLSAARSAGINEMAVVVGFSGEEVESWLSVNAQDVSVLWQKEQLGTGHAVLLAKEWWRNFENVMVLAGDTPLITSDTLAYFADYHIKNKNKCTVLSFEPEDPTGYGRVIRDAHGVRIVEHKDANAHELMCCEVNSGMYIFDTSALFNVIDRITCDNAQKEYYLPDALALIQKDGGEVDAVRADNSLEFLGVNDPLQLAESARLMRDRILERWMTLGVRCADPASTWIGPKAVLNEDIFIEPNVQMWGNTAVGRGCRIGSFTVLNNAVLGNDVTIVGSVRINNSAVGDGASVGPFVLIRDAAELMSDVHVGRFVEIKKSIIMEGAKVPHLSYIGDAKIGKKTNIGAGTITCNYDGKNKNSTVIGENCFIGSDTMLVAPVSVGDNAVTAAGSVVTRDVPEGALAIARSKQQIIENWRLRSIKGGK